MVGDEASQLWTMVAVFLFSRISGYNSIIFGGDDIQLDPYVHKDVAVASRIMTWIRQIVGVISNSYHATKKAIQDDAVSRNCCVREFLR